MAFDPLYRDTEPTKDEIDNSQGLVLLEFGENWCGHCKLLSPTVEEMLKGRPEMKHIRIKDGKGKRLGRSFRVKQWPTLFFLKDGKVVFQMVRPTREEAQQCMLEFLKL